jgi:hypothetical protein
MVGPKAAPAVMKIYRMNRKAVRARLDLIASERGFSRSELRKAKSSDDALIDFALASLDWLCLGDLRGLLRQVRGL